MNCHNVTVDHCSHLRSRTIAKQADLELELLMLLSLKCFWLRHWLRQEELKDSLCLSVRHKVLSRSLLGLFQVCLKSVSGLFSLSLIHVSLSVFLAYFVRQTEPKILLLVIIDLGATNGERRTVTQVGGNDMNLYIMNLRYPIDDSLKH